jgi:sulfatase maturation enzyme AslB (radical SAM superfamily)
MEWSTLRAAVELALRSRHREVNLLFYGGEPLLEFSLIRRAVELVRDSCPRDKKVTYSLITNGTLLDDDKADFLAESSFETQLSFDGLADAQDVRGKGTFSILDRRLDRLRSQHPLWFDHKLIVSMTLSSRTIPLLARSFEYFLSKGVREIGMHPLFTHDPGWKADSIDALDREFALIFEASKRHYSKTGEVPFPEFRRTESSSAPPSPSPAMCGAASGEALSVDVDGQLFGCVTFADSFQKYAGKFLRSRLDSMRLGDLRDPMFRSRLDAYPDAARAARLFVEKEKKYSSYAKCGECRYLATCTVCPTSIGHIPGNEDPHRVPDFQCAYNLVLNKYRDRFPIQASPADVLTGKGRIPDLMQELRRKVKAASAGAG